MLLKANIIMATDNCSVIINGKVKDQKGNVINNADIILFDEQKNRLKVIFSDSKGSFKLKLDSGKVYFLNVSKQGYQNKVLSINTNLINGNNYFPVSFSLENSVNEKQVLDFENIVGYIYINKSLNALDYSKVKPLSNDKIKESFNENDEKSLNLKQTIEQKGGTVNINLNIRASNGFLGFESCPFIHRGVVSLKSRNYSDSTIISGESGNVKLILKPNNQETIIQIKSPFFFTKTISLSTNDILEKNYRQINKSDTINILLDSCFNQPNKVIGILYYKEFKFGKFKTAQNVNVFKQRKDYLGMMEEAKSSRRIFYNNLLNNHNQLVKSVTSDMQEVNGEIKSSKDPIENIDPVISDKKSIEEFELNIDQLEWKQPSQFNFIKMVFKNENADKLPLRIKSDFQRFGFDTMPIYVEREVEKHLKDIIAASKNINTMQDTLNLYMHLYQLNKDFIYVGNKKISEIAGKSERQLLLVEILKVINEKELENYSIRKEVRELHLKLDAKSVLLKFERYKLIFIAIIAFFLLIIIYNKFHQYKKLKEITNLLNLKNREVKDSIQYAQRIQFAILPTQANIAKAFPQSFVLFKPKDIVTCDFYWFQ